MQDLKFNDLKVWNESFLLSIPSSFEIVCEIFNAVDNRKRSSNGYRNNRDKPYYDNPVHTHVFLYHQGIKVTCLLNARFHPNTLFKLYFLFSEFQLTMENWKN